MTQSAAGPSSDSSSSSSARRLHTADNTLTSLSSTVPFSATADVSSGFFSALSGFFSALSLPTQTAAGSSSASQASSCSGLSAANSLSVGSLADSSAWDAMSLSSADSCNDSEMRLALTAGSSAGCFITAAAAAARTSSPVAGASTATYDCSAGASRLPDSSLYHDGDGDSDDEIVWECWSPPKTYNKQHMSAVTAVVNGEQKKRKKSPVIYDSDDDDHDDDNDDDGVGKGDKSSRKRRRRKVAAASVTNAEATEETSVTRLCHVLKCNKQPLNKKTVDEWTGELFSFSRICCSAVRFWIFINLFGFGLVLDENRGFGFNFKTVTAILLIKSIISL